MIGKHLGNLWQILLDFVLAIFTNDCTHSNHSSEKIANFGEMLNFGSVQKCANLVDLKMQNKYSPASMSGHIAKNEANFLNIMIHFKINQNNT